MTFTYFNGAYEDHETKAQKYIDQEMMENIGAAFVIVPDYLIARINRIFQKEEKATLAYIDCFINKLERWYEPQVGIAIGTQIDMLGRAHLTNLIIIMR